MAVAGIHRKGNHPQVIKRYALRDTRGQVIAIHERTDGPTGKRIRWLRPDGSPGLNGMSVTKLPVYGSFRLTKLPGNTPVIVTEGEKACQALWQRRYAAVGTITGAATIPGDEPLRVLHGHPVVLWPDNDEVGRSHMLRIAERLQTLGHEDIRMVVWAAAPDAGDAADFCGTDDELQALLDAAGPVPTSEPFTLTRVADVEPRRVRWVWSPRIPLGKMTILDGDPGLGKSMVTLDVAARVSRRCIMPDGLKGDLLGPRGVVILSAEDDPADTIRPRLEAAGANLNRIGLLLAVRDGDGETRPPHLGDLDALRAAIKRVNAALVIVDPLMAFMPEDRDSHRDQDIRRALAPLAALANEIEVAIVVVRHLNKTSNGNPLYRGGGSIGIIGAARSGLLLARDPSDPTGQGRVVAVTKSNLSISSPSLRFRVIEAQHGVPKVEWLGESDHTAGDLLAAAHEDVADRRESQEVKEWLREVLAEGPVGARNVFTQARHVGLSEKVVRKAAKVLNVSIEKKSFREGWEWSLRSHADDVLKPRESAIAPKTANLDDVVIFADNSSTAHHKSAKSDEDDQDAEDDRTLLKKRAGHLRNTDPERQASPILTDLYERGKRKWNGVRGGVV